MNRNEKLNKIKGALYGVAVGDALGGPLEFMSAEAIQKKHGRVTEMIGGGWLGLEPGETTDDTAMTLAVAKGILENPENPIPAIGRRFIKWYKSGPKDIGNTCSVSISRAMRNGQDWEEAPDYAEVALGMPSEGNGALMRTIYPALYYNDSRKRRNVTRAIAQMTHSGSQSAAICEEYVELVRAAIEGRGAFSYLDKPGHAEPTGYVVDTYTNVMQAITMAGSFKEAVVEAVNRGGDADTIGAITGGLAGAIYGYHEIPAEWINSLDFDLRADLDRLADEALKNWE